MSNLKFLEYLGFNYSLKRKIFLLELPNVVVEVENWENLDKIKLKNHLQQFTISDKIKSILCLL